MMRLNDVKARTITLSIQQMLPSVPTVIDPEIARYAPTPMTIIGPISLTV